jgi:hypothetical protein
MRCKDCSQVRGYPFKRSHLVALRPSKISALAPPSTWWRERDESKPAILLTGVQHKGKMVRFSFAVLIVMD